MAIILNDNINLASNKPLDNRYGPYASVIDALNDVPAFQRHQGLVVGIVEDDAVVDYWFKDGVNNYDLVVKTLDYESIINIPTIPADISQLTDVTNILSKQDFSFTIEGDDSVSFVVSNESRLRLTGSLGISVEEDSSEGLIISGPDLSNLEQNVAPATTEIYDLGTPTQRWRDLYLSGNSIEIGAASISVSQDSASQATLVFGGVDSIAIGDTIIKAEGVGGLDLPANTSLDGVPLITRIDSNAFSLSISADDSVSTAVISGKDIQFVGAGGTTTQIDEQGNVVIISPTVPQALADLSDVQLDDSSTIIGKVLKYDGTNWVAADEAGSSGGSGSGDAATLNGFSGTYYLNYNNLANKPTPYSLPPATTTTLGGVIVGNNVTVNGAGRIDVPKGAGINTITDIPNVVDLDGLDSGDTLVYNATLGRWEVDTVDLNNAVMDGGFY